MFLKLLISRIILILMISPFILQCEYARKKALELSGLEDQLSFMKAPRNNTPVQSGMVGTVSSNDEVPEDVPNEKADWGSCEPLKEAGFLSVYKKATIQVDRILLLREDKEMPFTVEMKSREVDLFSLASFLSGLLSETLLPEGEYNEIHILVRASKIVDRKGYSWPLEIPEGQEKGIRIHLSRPLNIQDVDRKQNVSLNFCTHTNFLAKKSRSPKPAFSFYPLINRVVNISI